MFPWFLLLVRGRTQCIGRSAPSIFRLTVPVISLSLLLLLLLHLFLFYIFYFLARIIDCSITLLLPCRYILRYYIQGVFLQRAKIMHFFLQTSSHHKVVWTEIVVPFFFLLVQVVLDIVSHIVLICYLWLKAARSACCDLVWSCTRLGLLPNGVSQPIPLTPCQP